MNKSTRSTVTPEYERLSDAAARTGISVITLRRQIASGELPAYRLSTRPGSAYRVRCRDVDALLMPVIPTEVYAR